MTPRTRLVAARLGYVGIILLATLANLQFSWDPATAAVRAFWAFAEPLAWSEAVDGIRNAALFGGFGVVWVITAPAGRARGAAFRATALAFALSLAIETVQTFSLSRSASLLDVITDTLGAGAGALVMALLLRALRQSARARGTVAAPLLLVSGAYVAAALCEALTPLFRTARLPGAGGTPLERWNAVIHATRPLSLAEIPVFDLLLFVPAGFFVVMLSGNSVRPQKGAWIWMTLLTALLAALAHLAHGLIGRPVRWEAVATDAVAIGLGAWAARRRLGPAPAAMGRPDGRRTGVAAYCALLLLWGWRPLLPETSVRAIAAKFTGSSLMPLELLSQRQDVFSAASAAQQALLFIPLGVLLAERPADDEAWPGLGPALLLPFAVEVGHLLVVGRVFDVTNILLAWSGIGIGWIAIRRATHEAERDTARREPVG